MSNYFNSLPLRTQLQELGKCRFMDPAEFEAGVEPLAGKKLVIIGCGAQGFNQGLNLRDSGLSRMDGPDPRVDGARFRLVACVAVDSAGFPDDLALSVFQL